MAVVGGLVPAGKLSQGGHAGAACLPWGQSSRWPGPGGTGQSGGRGGVWGRAPRVQGEKMPQEQDVVRVLGGGGRWGGTTGHGGGGG